MIRAASGGIDPDKSVVYNQTMVPANAELQWHMRRLIQQHVGGLQHRVGEQRDRDAVAVLAALVLELGHPAEPAHPRGAAEQPLQLGIGRNHGLVVDHRLVRIDPAGDERRDHLAGVGTELGGDVRLAQRVKIGKEVEAFPAARGNLILHCHPVADRAEVVAKVEAAGGLDAGDDTHG
jgi:hypothetical protein